MILRTCTSSRDWPSVLKCSGYSDWIAQQVLLDAAEIDFHRSVTLLCGQSRRCSQQSRRWHIRPDISIWNLARCCLEKCDHRCGSGRACKENQFPHEDQAGCYRRCGDHSDSLPAMAEGISLLFEGHQTSCLNCAAGFASFFCLKCGRYLRTKWIYSLLADWWSLIMSGSKAVRVCTSTLMTLHGKSMNGS